MAEQIGHHRVERLLGHGAFSTVWLAYDEGLDAFVAIKVLADNWSRDEDVRHRFLEEARILRRAASDHIVPVHAVDELPDGRPYFVMSFADRGTLADRMAERAAARRPFTIDEAVGISLEIAEGLQEAHALGIVHRDLKPANVMIQSIRSRLGTEHDERYLLADFGMAKSLARSRGPTISTGTPHYMAPEQAEGRVDERSDLYSAAVILYELLAGRVPYPLRLGHPAPARPDDRGPRPDRLPPPRRPARARGGRAHRPVRRARAPVPDGTRLGGRAAGGPVRHARGLSSPGRHARPRGPGRRRGRGPPAGRAARDPRTASGTAARAALGSPTRSPAHHSPGRPSASATPAPSPHPARRRGRGRRHGPRRRRHRGAHGR
ncbi:MAG: serine/threonine protein kinase [Acidimicrobiia bacterium]|nr:serine/threonine protein kinase [Acidimicrobiia bacterium]